MRKSVALLTVAVGLLMPNPSWAHALKAECTLKNGKIMVEAFFDDDAPAVNAKVEVRDGGDQILAGGQTDVQGLWSCPAPAPGQYVLIVDAGMGHRAREPIAVPDVRDRPG